MLRLWRLCRIIRQLQAYQAFVSMKVSSTNVEFECWDGKCNVKGDEYTALRILRTLRENERRGLEWAKQPYKSGRTAA